MKLISPQPLPFEYEDWKKRPFDQRAQLLCQAWALQGYGAPIPVYFFYILKIGLYIGFWLLFASRSVALGPVSDIASWWFKPEALLKGILWSMMFEGIGMAAGSGPLTGRYMPPFGGIFHFLRPGTIKLPYLPSVPIIGGERRTWVDVLLYGTYLLFLLRALLAIEVTAVHLIPIVILLPVMALFDRTLFLISRGEHYWIATVCFLFPLDAIAGAKAVWWAIWFWAATSKLNRHFPAVIGVMVSNSAVLRLPWLRRGLYKNYPDDLRPSQLATMLAHMGTAVEYTFPLLLVFGEGGMLTLVGLVVMLGFHTFITSNVPMAVPIEWNFMMVYGGFVLFGHFAEVSLFSMESPLLITLIILMIGLLPIIGNLFPEYVSFLLSMRYYAGNWAYSIWLFKGDAEERLDECVPKAAVTIPKQLKMLYDEQTIELLVEMVIGFRLMHLHGRILHDLIHKAVDDIEQYTWRDGELVAGLVLGWNFGDGHLHREPLLTAVQNLCHFESGELRCIFVESQPFGRPYHQWRIVDAKDGLLEKGQTAVDDLMTRQPWPSPNKPKEVS